MIELDSRTLFEKLRRRVTGAPRPISTRYVLFSYPKSGRTWVRFMVDLYLARTYNRPVRNVFEVEKDPFVRSRHPILVTHFTFTRNVPYYQVGRFTQRKTIVPTSHGVLLTRNLYATLASHFVHMRNRTRQFDGTPSEFLRHPNLGVLKLITFYNFWLTLRAEFASSDVFSYEALKANPAIVFTQVLTSLGISPVNAQLVDDVVAKSSFERLQELALAEAYRGTVLAPTVPSNKNSWKVREGQSRGFRSVFSEDDLAHIRRLVDDLLIDKSIVDLST